VLAVGVDVLAVDIEQEPPDRGVDDRAVVVADVVAAELHELVLYVKQVASRQRPLLVLHN